MNKIINRTKSIFLILSILLSLSVLGQTTINGGIFSDQVWTKANNPYVVTGNTTVFPGVSLTIEPGVVVKFKKDILFNIRGTLNIEGEENDSITFTAADLYFYSDQSWGGIVIDVEQGGSVNASYLIFEYSYHGFMLSRGNTSRLVYDFSKSTFRNNYSAISAYGDDADIRTSILSCKFLKNENSIVRVTNALIENCLFSGGGYATYTSYPILVKNCEFHDLKMALQLQAGNAENCYIHHCEKGFALWPGTSIINSRLEYNDVAFFETYPFGYTSTSIHDNIICGNTYGIKGNTAFPYNISNNCWCVGVEEIPAMVHDAYDDPTLGIITFEPILTGCTITPPRPIIPPITTAIQPLSKNKTLTVFPNPTMQTIYFDRDISNAIVTIFNSESKLIFQQKINEQSINVSNFSNGYYIVSVQTENEIYHLNFIKE